MRADVRFLQQTKEFWANVRTISEKLGYTDRDTRQIKVPTMEKILKGFVALGLRGTHLWDFVEKKPTILGATLLEYFAYRADVFEQLCSAAANDGGSGKGRI